MQKLIILFTVPFEAVASGVAVAGAVFPSEVIIESDLAACSLTLHPFEKIERGRDRIYFTINDYKIGLKESLVSGFTVI